LGNALERKRRLGQYAVIWRDGRDGRVVRLEAEDQTPFEPATQRQPGA
jgi:hypothetical protein